MRKLKFIFSIVVLIGLFALSTQSAEVTNEEATEKIIAELDNIQRELDKNSNDQQVAKKQFMALEKLRDTYGQSDAFNESGVLDWYSTLEEWAIRGSEPPPVNQPQEVTLKPGEKIGTLEVEFVGRGGQVPVFRITAGSEKYAGILEHSPKSTTTEREIMKLARDAGLKVFDIGNLAGKRVIFKPIEKSRELTQSGGKYLHARIIAFLKD